MLNITKIISIGRNSTVYYNGEKILQSDLSPSEKSLLIAAFSAISDSVFEHVVQMPDKYWEEFPFEDSFMHTHKNT